MKNVHGKDFYLEAEEQETARSLKLIRRRLKSIVSRIRTVLRIEIHNGKTIDAAIRSKQMVPMSDFISRPQVRMSLKCLYRRYRDIRLRTLQEVLTISQVSVSRDETVGKIQSLMYKAASAKSSNEKVEKESC